MHTERLKWRRLIARSERCWKTGFRGVRKSFSSMPPEKSADQGRPDLNALSGVDEEMAIRSEVRQQMIFNIAAGSLKGRGQSHGKLGPKIAVVMSINPQHWYPRGSSELSRCFD